MTDPTEHPDLGALEKAAKAYQQWIEAGCPAGSIYDTYPNDIFAAIATPDAVLAHICMARSAQNTRSSPPNISEAAAAWMHCQGNHEEPSLRQLNDDEISRGWTQYPLYRGPQPQQAPTVDVGTVRDFNSMYAAAQQSNQVLAADVASNQQTDTQPQGENK